MSEDFDARVARAVKERDALTVQAGHSIECFRCSNDAFTDSPDATDARDEFHIQGWRSVDGFQMCPSCLGSGGVG